MGIYREKDAEGNGVGQMIEMDDVTVIIDTEEGRVQLQATMLLDKDGNSTDILFDTTSIIGKDPEGQLYEVDIKAYSWIRPTFH